MMKKLLMICAVILMITFPGILVAQINFTNNLAEPVYVAFAQYIAKPGPGHWMTYGWFTVYQNKTMEAFESIGINDSIGYFAVTTLSDTPYEGSRSLLVHPDEKFTIRLAEKDESRQKHPEYEWRLFRMIQIKPGTLKGTIFLKK